MSAGGYGVSKLTKVFRSFLKQAKTFNKDSVKLVGQDHMGNKYFEAYRPNHMRPVQRYYEAKKQVQSFDDVVEAVHVPPAWDAWLRFRRKEVPTEEEVLEGEQYFQMQQEMANSKKKEEPTLKPTNFKEDTSQGKKIPEGHYRKGIYD